MLKSSKHNIELVRKYKKGKHKVLNRVYVYWAIGIAMASGFCFLLVLAYQLGYSVGTKDFYIESKQFSAQVDHKEPPPKLAKDIDFEPFWDAWLLLEKHLVVGVNSSSTSFASSSDQDRVWGAITGLTASFDDPFTTFLPPEENELFHDDASGEFTGVGMEIGNRDQRLTVISPIPGTPAARAGIKPKDIISKIDGRDSLRMSVERAVKLIRGPEGEAVTLTVIRQGEAEPLEITIVRELINIPTIHTEIVNNVFVIKLFSFNAKSPRLFTQALIEFQKAQTPYLVIDLRGNPGGLLEAALDISSRFLDAQSIVVQEESENNNPANIYYSKGYDHFTEALQLVVLINAGSASASEIVAGALSDHSKAIIVGEESFGKGSVQSIFPLTKDTTLKITTAKWLTPNGASIDTEGIMPNIILEEPTEETVDEYTTTHTQDLSQDWHVQQAVEIVTLTRQDFKDLFDTIPQELQDRYKQE